MSIFYYFILFFSFVCFIYFFKFKLHKTTGKSILYSFLCWMVFMSIILYVFDTVNKALMTDEEKRELFVKDSLEHVRQDSLAKIEKINKQIYDKRNKIESSAIVFLKQHMHNPDSYKEVNINVFLVDSITNIYTVNIEYRAKNAFNAEILSEQEVVVIYDEKNKNATALGFNE